MTIKKTIGICSLLAVLVVAAYVFHRGINPPDYSIASVGGEYMVLTNVSVQPYYLQTDPEWKDETVAGSEERLSGVGCTLCCISMAFAQLGTAADPKVLNSYLKAHNGYTSSGLVKWNVATAMSKSAILFDLPRSPSHTVVDSAIQSGYPVITKIMLWESVPHWVLIVGKEGNEYLVKNPLYQKQKLQKLSTLSKTIKAIRIAKRM